MKTSALIIMLASALLLAGCGDDSGSPKSGTEASATIQQAIDKAVATKQLPALDTSSSILGLDTDGNGVRDDIDAYINSLNYSASQKAALRQMSVAYSIELTANIGSPTELANAGQKVMRGISCVISTLGKDAANTELDKLEAYHVNTRQRVDAYVKFSQAMNGSATEVPTGNTCD